MGVMAWGPHGSFAYKQGTRLVVTGINPNMKKTDLQSLFGEFGFVLKIEIQAGKAYIEFESKLDAADAVKALDGKRVQDHTIKVQKATDKGGGKGKKDDRDRSQERGR